MLLEGYNREIQELEDEVASLKQSRRYYKRGLRQAKHDNDLLKNSFYRFEGMLKLLYGHLNYDSLPQYVHMMEIMGSGAEVVNEWFKGLMDDLP